MPCIASGNTAERVWERRNVKNREWYICHFTMKYQQSRFIFKLSVSVSEEGFPTVISLPQGEKILSASYLTLFIWTKSHISCSDFFFNLLSNCFYAHLHRKNHEYVFISAPSWLTVTKKSRCFKMFIIYDFSLWVFMAQVQLLAVIMTLFSKEYNVIKTEFKLEIV